MSISPIRASSAAGIAAAVLLSFLPQPLAQSPVRPKDHRRCRDGPQDEAFDRGSRGTTPGILGLDEAFATKNPLGGSDLATFKVNDRQDIGVSPDLKADEDSRLIYVSFETADARALRPYLARQGRDRAAGGGPRPQGNLSLMVKDPEGNDVEFIQDMPGSLHTSQCRPVPVAAAAVRPPCSTSGYRIRDAAASWTASTRTFSGSA